MKDNRAVSDEFGQAISYYLKKRNMSLTKMANEAGVSVAYVSRLIRGERKAPSVPIAISIMKTLGMPSSYLLKVLELEGIEEEHLPDLYGLLLTNDFIIEEEIVNVEAKGILIAILESILTCDWSEKTIAEDAMVIAHQIGKLKTVIN